MSENAKRATGWPAHRVTGVDVWPFRLHRGEAQFLLIHRVPGEDAAFWQGVSGWIEADELPHHAALRELAEETGLPATALYTVNAIFDLYQWRRGTVETIVPFAAEVADGVDPTISDEHDAWRWESAPATLAMLTYEPQRKAVRLIVADLLDRPGSADLYRIGIAPELPEKTR